MAVAVIFAYRFIAYLPTLILETLTAPFDALTHSATIHFTPQEFTCFTIKASWTLAITRLAYT